MNDGRPDAEREFLITGARTYLDADDAMKEFRRQIQDQSSDVVCARLKELKQVCDGKWSQTEVRPYSARYAECFEVGHWLPMEELGKSSGGLYFCLKLSRDPDPLHAVAYLYRDGKRLATTLWGSFKQGAFPTSSMGTNNLSFARRLPEESIHELRNYLGEAITDLVAFIDGCGGLRKHLAQGT